MRDPLLRVRGPWARVMPAYRIDVPDDVGEVTVTCEAHGGTETFPGDRRTVGFHCPDCERELEVTLHDTADWRELTERC